MNSNSYAYEMLKSLKNDLLDKWYPLIIDNEEGGFFTNSSADFKLLDEQEKMIVTQARHIWTLSKAAEFFGSAKYSEFARYGADFLYRKMWDHAHGGFYQIRNRYGGASEIEGWFGEKRMYGNAFAIYGLSALHNLTKSESSLNLALNTFDWIEDHCYDPEFGGYFQFLTSNGDVFEKNSEYKTKATDAVEVGFKDQNSSIHLMEAYTELYSVHKDQRLKKQLSGILEIIRDRILHPAGYLRLFFERDWTHVSFRDAEPRERSKNYRLDHISFGHDYETAFLMLEASHTLDIENDIKTLTAARTMADHALRKGWDDEKGGFWDEGYYLPKSDQCEIIKRTKVWWAQAEAMNIYLLLYKIFDEEKYWNAFARTWEFIKEYIIDNEHGGWFWGSIDNEPFYKIETKGNIWKGTYHNARALMNCIAILTDENFELAKANPGFVQKQNSIKEFISHWRKVAEGI